MPDKRASLGSFGEQIAANYLTRQGYRVEARNWRCVAGEIDLVMRDGRTLVFVEVRTRRSAPAGTAEESVGTSKRARLAALAYAYLEAHTLPEATSWRIDVVAIAIDRAGQVAHINHIPNAVEEG